MPRLSLFPFFTLFFIGYLRRPAQGFSVHSSSEPLKRTKLFAISQNESEEERKQRMKLVRSLQDIYYKNDQRNTYTSLNETTGIIKHLPLWRVQWTELPGRSNVLNVHDPIYTNMFESILSRPKPWYFGHLYLPGGSKSLRSEEYEFELKNWQDDSNLVEDKDPKSRTSVVGTLMRISDVRRLQDGRLCLLVVGIERFVVQNAIQNLPYSIADVQILPDFDQLFQTVQGETTKTSRAQAIQESLNYLSYEFAEISLPLSKTKKYMTQTEVYGSWLVDLLPFAAYEFVESYLPPKHEYRTNGTYSTAHNDTRLSLESQLLKHNVLRRPPSYYEKSPFPEDLLSNDQLEQRLWNALEDYCGATGSNLHKDIACLLPPDRPLPAFLDTYQIKRLSRNYPDYRRQRRFSFAASALLESIVPKDLQLRQVLLETPSTNERLFSVLQWFDLVNAQLLGEFQ